MMPGGSPISSVPSMSTLRTRRTLIRAASALLEVGALVDRQSLQEAPDAVEAQLHRAQTHPLAAAHDPAAARGRAVGPGDGQTYGAAELDAVGALVDVDQHGQRVRRAADAPQRVRDRLGRLLGQLAGRRGAVETDRPPDFAQIA